jgi:hypothetical protein
VGSAVGGTATGKNTPWMIKLGVARLELTEGRHAPIRGSREPFLVQLRSIPSQSMIDTLRGRGVTLLNFAAKSLESDMVCPSR